jgi:hypothetical protein
MHCSGYKPRSASVYKIKETISTKSGMKTLPTVVSQSTLTHSLPEPISVASPPPINCREGGWLLSLA